MSHEVAPSRMEPARIEEVPERLADLVAEVISASHTLGRGLHPRTLQDLAMMVRLMNSYYSNRIEGNNTRPREIERALGGDFDADPARRVLQQENTAHIALQARLDVMAAAGDLPDPTTGEFIQHLHSGFYAEAMPSQLEIGKGITMVPGQWRYHDVEVGRHVPPPHDKIPSFMAHFHERFRMDRMGPSARILAIATAHHRFAWIHPFYDGNGRVARLMSHAMAHHAGIATNGLWSISRGLARGLQDGLEGREEYKPMMALADRPRQGDRDGRGALSLAALISFTDWFLKVCLDQITFMSSLFQLDSLEERLTRVLAEEGIRPEAEAVMRYILRLGEIPRGAVAQVAGLSERTGQRLIESLTHSRILGSDTPKGPLSLRFPVATHALLFPRLFDQS